MPRKKKFRDPEEAAWDARLKAESEDEDFGLFVSAYARATGDALTAIERPEPPDFLCLRSNGREVGVELTQIMRSPDSVLWDSILYRRTEMGTWSAATEFDRLLSKKVGKLENFPTKENILLIQSCDADFGMLTDHLLKIPITELKETGFQEIWLGDYQGYREGAHYGIELHGLFPAKMRHYLPRADWDQKPYG